MDSFATSQDALDRLPGAREGGQAGERADEKDEHHGKRGTFTVAGSNEQPAVGNSALTLNSRIPLGMNASEFRLNRFIVTHNGFRNIIPTWSSSNRMKVALPAGEGGTDATLEIRRDGQVVGVVTVSYLGKVTNATWVTDPAHGERSGTIIGTGLSRTQNWRLTSPDGENTLELPFVGFREDLDNAVRGGVFVARDSQVFVNLPADVPGRPGTWKVEFDPIDGSSFAPLSPASKLDVIYLAPRVSRLSGSGVSTEGGTEITIHGSNLGSVNINRPGAVLLRPEDGGEDVPCRVTSVRQTAVVCVVPALTAGPHRVVLRTGMGETDDGLPREGLMAVTPVPGRSQTKEILGIGGPVVLRTTDVGISTADMIGRKVTARVEERPLPLKWLSETTVQATLPPGPPGSVAQIVLSRHGVASPPIPVSYAAAITATSRTVLPTAGGTVRFTGVGLSGDWRLHPVAAGDDTGRDVPLTDITLDEKGRSATVDLPPLPQGVYQVVFTPDQHTFKDAVSVFTSKTIVAYSDFG